MYDKYNNIFYQNVGSNSWASLNTISKHVINGTIATEDKNFYTHRGFDILRIIKALYVDISKGSLEQGASTISQQYVKNLYLSFDKTWKRKIEEAFLTLDLELHYDKREILEGYLNTINFGSGCFGIEEASLFYFNKHASELTLSEASIIVGIPKNPTYYNPIYYFNNAKDRQLSVLESMVNNGYISEEEADYAYSEKLNFYAKKNDNLIISSLYYRDATLDELSSIKEIPKSLISSGLKIYTSLDTPKQERVEALVNEELGSVDSLQIALMIRDVQSGAVIGLIGGRNYAESEYNRVTQSKRQVGSTIKPILYLAALKNGMTPISTFSSQKTNFSLGNGVYSPKNYADNYPNRDITMAQAISLSDNIYAVKTHLFLGSNALISEAKTLGVKENLMDIASLALGTAEINMLDYSNAFATLANSGIKNEPYFISKVTDLNDNVIYEREYYEETVEDIRYIYILNDMLNNTYNYNYIDYASPTLLSVSSLLTHKYAVKSGTTDTDLWVVGYNKNVLGLVWNGFDDNSRVDNISSNITKRIWAKAMEIYASDNYDDWYDIPKGVTGSIVNPVNGSTSDLSKKDLLFFIRGTEPNFIK